MKLADNNVLITFAIPDLMAHTSSPRHRDIQLTITKDRQNQQNLTVYLESGANNLLAFLHEKMTYCQSTN